MTVELNWWTVDTIFVNPKFIWDAMYFFKKCKQTVENCKQISKIENTASQCILALPT